jgi:hypothetical protein
LEGLVESLRQVIEHVQNENAQLRLDLEAALIEKLKAEKPKKK